MLIWSNEVVLYSLQRAGVKWSGYRITSHTTIEADGQSEVAAEFCSFCLLGQWQHPTEIWDQLGHIHWAGQRFGHIDGEIQGPCLKGLRMKAVVPVGQRQRFSTLEIIRNWLVAFTRGFADSLRGAIELFLLDYRYLNGKIHEKRCLSSSWMEQLEHVKHTRIWFFTFFWLWNLYLQHPQATAFEWNAFEI